MLQTNIIVALNDPYITYHAETNLVLTTFNNFTPQKQNKSRFGEGGVKFLKYFRQFLVFWDNTRYGHCLGLLKIFDKIVFQKTEMTKKFNFQISKEQKLSKIGNFFGKPNFCVIFG